MKFPLRVRRGAQCCRTEDAQGRTVVLRYESDAVRAEAMSRRPAKNDRQSGR